MDLGNNITKDSSIGEIIDKGLVDILIKNGLNCLGCPASNNESLQEAVKGHGINLEEILEKLNTKNRK